MTLALAPNPNDGKGMTIGQLLKAGHDSPRPRTRKLADRLDQAIRDLRDAVRADVTAAEAAAREAEQRKVANAEVARLQAELAEARKRAGMHAGPARTDPRSQQIRTWANSTGVPCPARGRIPRRVVDAYEAAHGA